MDFVFIADSLLLGVGLAMDAFSVSAAYGLTEPAMKKPREIFISGTFGVFQFAMPLLGWILVKTAVNQFEKINRFIPWAAFIILMFLGIKMIIESLRENREKEEKEAEQIKKKGSGFFEVILRGIATSIDALSAGLTIESYSLPQALSSSAIIGAVTFALCLFGIFIGKKAGMKFSKGAGILGGSILIIIGIKIFLSGITG